MLNWFRNLFKKEIVTINVPYKLPEPSAGERELPGESDRGKVKLGVIVGHTKGAPGAKMCEPYGLYEFSYNLSVAEAMKAHAPHNLEVEIIQRQERGVAGAYAEAREKLCDAVIELHFNASNGQAKGTETLCSPDMSDVEFTHIIHKSIVGLFKREGRFDRGVKTISKSSRGGINVHSFPGGVNCLVEPFFGDNFEDATVGMDKRTQYARCLLDAVVLWARKVDLIK